MAKATSSGHSKQGKAVELAPATVPAVGQLAAAAPLAIVQAEQDAARSYRQNEKSAGTRRAYGSDFRIFRRLVRGTRCAAPAGQTGDGRNLHRRRGRRRHQAFDYRPAPCRDPVRPPPRWPADTHDAELVGVTMRGIRRTLEQPR